MYDGTEAKMVCHACQKLVELLVNGITVQVDFQGTSNLGAFDRSMQHHLGTNLFEGGVHDPTKTVETFSRGKDRHLAAMEVRGVPARDWAHLWQATCHHSQDIDAIWGHSSPRSSPLAASFSKQLLKCCLALLIVALVFPQSGFDDLL